MCQIGSQVSPARLQCVPWATIAHAPGDVFTLRRHAVRASERVLGDSWDASERLLGTSGTHLRYFKGNSVELLSEFGRM